MRSAICCVLLLVGAGSPVAAQTCGEGQLLSSQDLTSRLGPWRYRRSETTDNVRRELTVTEQLSYEPAPSRTDICVRVRPPASGVSRLKAEINLVGVRNDGGRAGGTDFFISLGENGTIGLMEYHAPFEERDRTWVKVGERLRTGSSDVNEVAISLRDEALRLTINGVLAGTITAPEVDPDASWSIALVTETLLSSPAEGHEGRNYVFESVKLSTR